MKRKFHCQVCGKRTRVVSAENADMGEWKKSSKVLAPGHGFNSKRSKQSENGGRP